MSSLGVPTFKLGVDGSVVCRNQHPARFTSPRGCSYHCLEVVTKIEYLRSRHKSGLLRRQISSKVRMKLCRVEVSKTVYRLLYRTRLAEITREALSVVRLVLSSVWHMGRDVHQTVN